MHAAAATAAAPRLSLVLPCYNGGAYVATSLRALHAWLADHAAATGPAEVILVDDGSRDDTVAAAAATGLPVRIERQDRNRGKGAAVRRGMRVATGTFRVFMDADLPFDLGDLERVLHYLDFKEFDVVVGSRAVRGHSYAVARPAERRLASRVFSELVGRLVVTGVRDTQCGLKGFRAPIADYLFRESRVDRFAFDVELLYLAFKNGFDVKSIPVHMVAELPSTLQVARDGLPMLLEVLRLPLRFHTGGYRLFEGPPGGGA
ncbi:MAG TPA: glycosyltransferase [Candidatus Eisenbacteria bacterium]|nr:glycosyltransferase [Candidatus Eisenbacteria bacterium]